MGKKGKIITGVIVLAIIVVAGYFYEESSTQIPSNIKTEKPGKEKKIQKTFNIGFIPSGDSEELVKIWQPMADYLKKELKMPVELVFGSNYREIINALVSGKADLVLLGSCAYLDAYQEIKISPLVRRIKFGSSYYHSIIFARKDSGINKIEDLKGKSFAFTDKESTSGYCLPMAMLRENGIDDPNSFFSEVIFTTTHDAALTAVYNKLSGVDAAAIASSWWQDPHQRNKVKDLKIILQSGAVPLGPFCVRDQLDKELIKKIKKAFLKIGRTKNTLELSKHLKSKRGIDGFEDAKDSDYDIIRNLLKSDIK